jgi:hypothetical protein
MFHISLTRLAAFLVQERPLDDEEQGHLSDVTNANRQWVIQREKNWLLKKTHRLRNHKSKAGVRIAQTTLRVLLPDDSEDSSL